MKWSVRTLSYHGKADWRSRVCFVWNACDDVFKDSWFVHSMLFVARFTSFFVVELGMGLVVFCTVVSAREVVPVLARQSRAMYHFLNTLIIVVTFNILFNYVCACTFSCCIGRAPRHTTEPLSEPVPTTMTATPTAQLQGPATTNAVTCRAREEHEESNPAAALLPATAVAVEEPSGLRHRPRYERRCGVKCGPGMASCLRPCGEARITTPAELAEIDHIAAVGERYTPRERRYKLLDEPRRFCAKCNRLKAPREHHCNVCGVCVSKMDHHCPWINSCVDAENLRYFFLFLFWLTLGTLLDSTILGYGFYRQHRYEKQVRALKDQARSSSTGGGGGAPGTACTTSSAPPVLRAPFGDRGSRMTSFPVVLTIVITGIMFFCLFAFLYATARMVLRNTTVIEHFIVEDKRHVYRATSFVYQNPYDLGPVRNIVEVFRTQGDPFVRDVVAYGWSGLSHAADSEDASAGRPPRKRTFRLQPGLHSWQDRLLRVGQQVLLIGWLVLPPTMRPTDCDGMHFPTFFAEASAADEEMLSH